MKDDSEADEWNVSEKVLQEMKESYRQVRRKDHKSPGPHITISDSELCHAGTCVVRICQSISR